MFANHSTVEEINIEIRNMVIRKGTENFTSGVNTHRGSLNENSKQKNT